MMCSVKCWQLVVVGAVSVRQLNLAAETAGAQLISLAGFSFEFKLRETEDEFILLLKLSFATRWMKTSSFVIPPASRRQHVA